jgi:hypothetical protein
MSAPTPVIENPRQAVVDEHAKVFADPEPEPGLELVGDPTSNTPQPMGSVPADANPIDAMLKSMRAQRQRAARADRTPLLRDEWHRPMDTLGCYEKRGALRGESGVRGNTGNGGTSVAASS